jgi:hypothetical protein
MNLAAGNVILTECLETWRVIGSSRIWFLLNTWLSKLRFFEADLRLVTEIGHIHWIGLCAWLLFRRNQVQNGGGTRHSGLSSVTGLDVPGFNSWVRYPKTGEHKLEYLDCIVVYVDERKSSIKYSSL